MNMVLRRAASPHAEGSPPPQGGLATGQPSSICRVPAQRASLVLAKATPLPCHPWQQRGLVVVPAALQFHHLGAKGAAISHLLPPSLRRERLRATLTDFMGSPAASGQFPLEFPLQFSATLSVISNAIPSTFPSSISTGMAIAIHFATPSALLTDSHCNSRCNFHSDSHCDSPCISQCTALLTVTPFAIPTAIPSSTPGLALLVHH